MSDVTPLRESAPKPGGLCDVAPSRFDRIGSDSYFTIDADWVIPALCGAIHVSGPILEPCAGRGHMALELRKLGFKVDAADLHIHADPLIGDIVTGADALERTSLAGYRYLITNFPYGQQDDMLARLLPIGVADGCRIVTLARSEWSSARERRALVHDNPCFAGEVRLTKRPVWVRPVIASPRHWFSWFCWDYRPRLQGREPFLRFAGAGRSSG
jgi:hypothetical protein